MTELEIYKKALDYLAGILDEEDGIRDKDYFVEEALDYAKNRKQILSKKEQRKLFYDIENLSRVTRHNYSQIGHSVSQNGIPYTCYIFKHKDGGIRWDSIAGVKSYCQKLEADEDYDISELLDDEDLLCYD